MGFYIQGPTLFKDEYLVSNHGARRADVIDARKALRAGEGVIVVMHNGPFDAAGFAFNEQEFNAFTDLRDSRPRTILVMDRRKAEELSGYANAMREARS